MIRTALLGIVLLSFAMVSVGCGSATERKADMPVKTGPVVDPKTGKKSKVAPEVSLEDPNVPSKKK